MEPQTWEELALELLEAVFTPEPVRDYAPVRGCGKLCFTSKRAARWAHSKAHWRLRVYYCAECRAWHCTNDQKTKHWRHDR